VFVAVWSLWSGYLPWVFVSNLYYLFVLCSTVVVNWSSFGGGMVWEWTGGGGLVDHNECRWPSHGSACPIWYQCSAKSRQMHHVCMFFAWLRQRLADVSCMHVLRMALLLLIAFHFLWWYHCCFCCSFCSTWRHLYIFVLLLSIYECQICQERCETALLLMVILIIVGSSTLFHLLWSVSAFHNSDDDTALPLMVILI